MFIFHGYYASDPLKVSIASPGVSAVRAAVRAVEHAAPSGAVAARAAYAALGRAVGRPRHGPQRLLRLPQRPEAAGCPDSQRVHPQPHRPSTSARRRARGTRPQFRFFSIIFFFFLFLLFFFFLVAVVRRDGLDLCVRVCVDDVLHRTPRPASLLPR